MREFRVIAMSTGVACAVMLCGAAIAELATGMSAPDIRAQDVMGRSVVLDEILAQTPSPYLVVIFCFTEDTGADLAVKLQSLQTRYGRDKFQVIAVGMAKDETALKDFAERMGIRYHVVDPARLQDDAWLKQVSQLPLTLFVDTTGEKRIDYVLAGGGASTANVMTSIAESFYRKRTPEAVDAARQAVSVADAPETRELMGFALLAEGKLDEAEKEFTSIGSTSGLAKVAMERGDYAQALEIASQSEDAYAAALRKEALARQGKLDEVAQVPVPASPAATAWQASEAANIEGRIAHAQGNVETALGRYRESVALDPYNVIALSNEAAAQLEQGKLDESQTLLERAQRIGGDDLVTLLLAQVKQQMAAQADIQRNDAIRKQIQELGERYRALRASGQAQAIDDWTSRPLTLALLPASQRPEVFLDRAGLDIALQREIEARLQANTHIQVVERAMLDALLRELELGSSELVQGSTQQRLGQVLAAQYLGFFEFVPGETQPTLYLRLINTETTGLVMQASGAVSPRDVKATADQIAGQVLAGIVESRELRGLIADVTEEGQVILNIGSRQGVVAGQVYQVLVDGAPVESNGRIIAYRQQAAGRLRVTEAQPDYALCEILMQREGQPIPKGAKVRMQSAQTP